MANTIFRYEWKGLNTKWDYRLDIYDNSDDLISSPTIVLLEPGTVTVQSLNTSFDKYRIGMPKIPIMKMTFYIDCIPDTSTYHPLIDSLLYPVRLAYIEDENLVQYEFERGTVFRLYSKFNGNSDTSDYREIFTGIQRVGIENGNWDIDTNQIDVECELINTVAISQLKTYDILKRIPDNYSLVKKKSLIYTQLSVATLKKQLVGFNSYVYGSGQLPDLFWVKLCNFRYIFDSAAEIASLIHASLLKTSTVTSYTIKSTQLSYYKQLFDGSGSLGSAVGTDALYFLFSMGSDAYESFVASEVYNISDNNKGSLSEKYPYFWDFYSEHSESQLSWVDLMNDVTIGLRPFFYSSGSVTIDFVNSFELDNIGGDTLLNITSSLQENIGDDISKFEFNEGRKSQNSFNLPVIFNNMGNAVSYKEVQYDTNLDPATINDGSNVPYPTNPACLVYDGAYNSAYYFRQIKKATEEHLLDLFYLDETAQYWAGIGSMPFKVHEFISVAVGDGTNTKDIEKTEITPFNITTPYNYLVNGRPTEMYIDMQKETFSPALLPKILNLFCGNKKLAKIKIEVNLDQFTDFQAGGSLGFVWWNKIFEYKFIYDLTEFHSRLVSLGTEWYAIACEINLENETAKIELINKVI